MVGGDGETKRTTWSSSLGDGAIDFREMKLILRCFLDQSPSLDLEETLAELTATLFQETDVDQSGDITLDELTSAFRRNEHLFKVLSLRFVDVVSISIVWRPRSSSTSSWIQPRPASVSKYFKHTLTLRSQIRNNIGLVFFWSLYLFICIGISINVLYTYIGQQSAHFLVVIARVNGETDRSILVSLINGRILGGMLNFNCALILVLMLRKHITWLRSKGGSLILPLDHHIDIHKIIGVIILIETILHTAAHLAYLGRLEVHMRLCREEFPFFLSS